MSRSVFDKRTLRRRYGAAFADAIAEAQAAGTFLDDVAAVVQGDPVPCAGEEPIQVFARKRPLFKEEAEAGEFDVVAASRYGCLVYACRFRADLATPFLTPHYSPLYTLDETASNSEVVRRARLDELLRIAASGSDSALCCFGQTGSGKSHTMAAVLQHSARQLFGSLGLLPRTGLRLVVSAYEVVGSSAHDLLAQRAKLRVRDTPVDGACVDAARYEVRDASELQALLQVAARARRTAHTSRNEWSSRSHAFYELHLAQRKSQGEFSAEALRYPGGGSVLLVDLAGSERAADVVGHDAERTQSSAEINGGLAALKECFRARAAAARAGPDAAPIHVPYRDALLCRLMRRVMEPRGAGLRAPRVVVVATISPAASDTEATLNTIRHAMVMSGINIQRDGDMALGDIPLPPAAQPGPAQLEFGIAGHPLPVLRRIGGSTSSASTGAATPPSAGSKGAATAPFKSGRPTGASAASARRSPGGTPRAASPRGTPGSAARAGALTPMRSSLGSAGGVKAARTTGGGPQSDSGAAGSMDQRSATPPASIAAARAARYRPASVLRRAATPPPLPAGPPSKWSPADVHCWVTQVANGRFAQGAAALPPTLDGRSFCRFSEIRFKQLFGGDDVAARRGKALYDLLREEMRGHREARGAAAREAAEDLQLVGRRRSGGGITWM